MKKWLIGLAIIFALAIIATYIFIPGSLAISRIAYIKSAENSAYRAFADQVIRQQWWPEQTLYRYEIKGSSNIYEITMSTNGRNIPSTLVITPETVGVVRVAWRLEYHNSSNPFKRIQLANQAKQLQAEMTSILERLQTHLEKEENMYGIKVEKISVKDTLLLTTKADFPAIPSTQQVYELIRQLEQHLLKTGASATGAPMLHAQRINSQHATAMVAIPVNKVLTNEGNLVFKRMVPGNILVTEVRGGPTTISNALIQLNNYRLDHHLESPAIPFESLITDRSKEPDTTKWITKIYYPVF